MNIREIELGRRRLGFGFRPVSTLNERPVGYINIIYCLLPIASCVSPKPYSLLPQQDMHWPPSCSLLGDPFPSPYAGMCHHRARRRYHNHRKAGGQHQNPVDTPQEGAPHGNRQAIQLPYKALTNSLLWVVIFVY